MKNINVEKTLLCHLLACDVPKSAIRIVRAEHSDIVTVSVTGQYGTKVRDYSVFQLLNGKPYVVDEMVKIALWYHGTQGFSRPHWWHGKTRWQQSVLSWLILWWICCALGVGLGIAKHFGWYK